MIDAVDFELEIGPRSVSGYPVTGRVSGGGEASELMRWSIRGRELDGRLAAIRDAVLASSATVRRVAAPDEQPVRAFGQGLFEAAVTGKVRSLYWIAYQQSRQEGRQLRLVLRIAPPELARLPWEYLFDPDADDYIGLQVPVVRYPQVREPRRPLAPPNGAAATGRGAGEASGRGGVRARNGGGAEPAIGRRRGGALSGRGAGRRLPGRRAAAGGGTPASRSRSGR
jgi:hypothetical protein